LSCLSSFIEAQGPLGLVALEITGPADSRSTEISELAVVLMEDFRASPRALHSLFRVRGEVPRRLAGLGGPDPEELKSAPALSDWREHVVQALQGRTLIARDAKELRGLLVRDFAPGRAFSMWRTCWP
jgi:hypothetical protein